MMPNSNKLAIQRHPKKITRKDSVLRRKSSTKGAAAFGDSFGDPALRGSRRPSQLATIPSMRIKSKNDDWMNELEGAL